jgi:hypothetical protein
VLAARGQKIRRLDHAARHHGHEDDAQARGRGVVDGPPLELQQIPTAQGAVDLVAHAVELQKDGRKPGPGQDSGHFRILGQAQAVDIELHEPEACPAGHGHDLRQVRPDHVHAAQGATHLLRQRALLVVHLGGAELEVGFPAVDDLPLVVLEGEILVAGVLDLARDAIQDPAPILLFPFVGAGRPVPGLEDTMVADVHGVVRRALGAQGAFADGIVGIALGTDELPVLDVHDDLTSAGAEGAGRDDLLGSLDLQPLRIRVGGFQIEPQLPQGHGRDAGPGDFHEPSP